MPAEQLNLILPEGLSANQTCADGLLSLAIDDAATDWVKALASTGGTGAMVEGRWQVRMPQAIEAPKFAYGKNNP